MNFPLIKKRKMKEETADRSRSICMADISGCLKNRSFPKKCWRHSLTIKMICQIYPRYLKSLTGSSFSGVYFCEGATGDLLSSSSDKSCFLVDSDYII